MAVIAVIGSPRSGGNSETIVDAVLAGAKENGKAVKKYNLNKMKIVGCQACMGCKKSGKCVQKDEMVALLEDIKTAEAIVVSSPIYFGQPSAQFRMFQDRTYSLFGMDFSSFIDGGKKIVSVVTCGSGVDAAEKVATAMEGAFVNLMKMTLVDRLVLAGGGPPNVAAGDMDLIAKAKAVGKKL